MIAFLVTYRHLYIVFLGKLTKKAKFSKFSEFGGWGLLFWREKETTKETGFSLRGTHRILGNFKKDKGTNTKNSKENRPQKNKENTNVSQVSGNPNGGLTNGGLAQKAPIGPKKALSGEFLLPPLGCEVRRNRSQSAPKRPR